MQLEVFLKNSPDLGSQRKALVPREQSLALALEALASQPFSSAA